MKGEVYKRKVDMRDELLARILDDAASIKKHDEKHAIFANEWRSG